MYILGIHTCHNSTAALLKDGKIIGCVSEERFVRIKNYWGFPVNSVKYLLDFAKITSEEIDLVVFSEKRATNLEGRKFDMFENVIKEKGMFKEIFSNLTYRHPGLTNYLIKLKNIKQDNPIYEQGLMNEARKFLNKNFNISPEKIIFLDHHLSHAYSTCFNLPKNKKHLVFSIDGEGDESTSATVNIFDGKNMERIAETKKEASLGYLYSLVTFYLGMKPNEHEFKVMGLAPYAKKEKVEKIYTLFKETLWLDGMNFKSKFRTQYFIYFLKDKMKGVRFDTIAGAVQRFTEDLLCDWVSNSIKQTGISSIALSGGVVMNVKACQKIAELPEVKEIFIVPSAADESTAIGACFYGYKHFCEINSLPFNPKQIESLYLGPEYSNKEIEKFLKENYYSKKYRVDKIIDIEKKIASLLAKGEIVARLNGRSEFGARALGNRSILADPSNNQVVRVLNELIKDRDFWMPFTPSVLFEGSEKYMKNPRKLKAPYMVITFDSTTKGQEDLSAAIHPYDFTLRPQMVYKDWNLSYHRLISEFKKLRGISGILNTSFNLHGEPNVLSPKDAMHTFENSGLKYLALGNFLVSKN